LANNVLTSVDKETGEMTLGKNIWGRSLTDNFGSLSDILVGDGTRVFMRHTVLNEDCQEEIDENKMQMLTYPHLYSNSGLLDEEHFHRTSWNIDSKLYTGKKAKSFKQGQMLVYDQQSVYGIRTVKRSWHDKNSFSHPGTTGYTYFSDAATGEENRWSVKVPLRANAMALTKSTFFAAGAPDVVSKEDPFAAFEGRIAGKLIALDVNDGQVYASYPLASSPVFDGMAIAGKRIYVSLQNGDIVCFCGKQ
jgi:hypothetical protein